MNANGARNPAYPCTAVYVELDNQMIERGQRRFEITQFPIAHAYAMTVHKSQGQTLERAVIDISRAHDHGLAYVALSRLTNRKRSATDWPLL